jgi:hypothetical protein
VQGRCSGTSVLWLWQILTRVLWHPGSSFLADCDTMWSGAGPESDSTGPQGFLHRSFLLGLCVACWWPGSSRQCPSMCISWGTSSSCALLLCWTGAGTCPLMYSRQIPVASPCLRQFLFLFWAWPGPRCPYVVSGI